MTTDEVLADLEDARSELSRWRELYGADEPEDGCIDGAQGRVIMNLNRTVAEQAKMIDSLSTLWLTIRAAARAVVDQVPVEDREGPGWADVRLADLRVLDAASLVEAGKK